ncbi:tetratricopeptide repeat protein [Paracoccus sp. SMMA_5_TC]|uniref:tetratricopeptide repeat protein n=1 Tax=Paracoccus sp. SMMA_5_TC TaxID=2654280 RepID=UPI0012B25E4E|nr:MULTISPECIES: tetratricopeptide repeat protein [unclassified Paracoccus (in: a-proteobacteria)]UXU76267.1 tetratricopeptide repeat protein [Paracoccus sp. SMMA_5]UXU81305.1 tetratricopeptide repeat protein [Paracoccus sp. SMMA_5_TC]
MARAAFRGLLLSAVLALPALPALAQDKAQTLADIRGELARLSADLQALRGELVASGPAGFAAAGGDSAIDRMNAMEARLAALTGQTEQLQNRIDRIVKDGTTRIGDIEFRLCEMEEGCDLGSLTTPPLGEQGGGAPAPAPDRQGALQKSQSPVAGVATAAEQADFDRAREVLGQGDFRRAAELFQAVAQTHAGGALTAQAMFLRGAALDSAGDLQGAGLAWLDSFAADPDGTHAPDALLGLARAMAARGGPAEGCYYLQEILARFPYSPQAEEAERRLDASQCALDEAPAAIMPEAMTDPEAAADLADGG